MYRRGPALLIRAKGGQKAWTPTSYATTAANAPNALSGSEAAKMAYRPLPLQDTVESEEDYGHNFVLQREFIPKRVREQVSFDDAPLAHSATEMRRAQERLAGRLNHHRNAAAKADVDGAPVPVFEQSFDDNAPLGHIDAARYVFDKPRIDYFERFERSLGDARFTALGEACAVIFGCREATAKEAWFKTFLGLDKDTLEQEAEALWAARAELDIANKTIADRTATDAASEPADAPAQLAATPAALAAPDAAAGDEAAKGTEAFLFEDDECEYYEETLDATGAPVAVTSAASAVTGSAAPSASNPSATKPASKSAEASALPAEFAEFAPVYREYEAYCLGRSPVAPGPAKAAAAGGVGQRAVERQQWRRLMDRLVREDYVGGLSEAEERTAADLNAQLLAVKLLDARLGETIKEAASLAERQGKTMEQVSGRSDRSPTSRTKVSKR